MSRFNGTKGIVGIIKMDKDSKKYPNVFVHIDNNIVGTIFGKSNEEAEANAELISDAFNTITECDLMPSELLKQRNEMFEMLKKCSGWIANCNQYAGVLKEIDELITRAKI